MISELLPDDVNCVEAYDDSVAVRLFPAEELVIARAVEKRRREFATVRRCAREALADLGFPAAPILPGERGAPGWPTGVVGSMTHCVGYRAAAVALATTMVSLGIDAEPHEPVPAGVMQLVATDEELRDLAVLGDADPTVCWDRLLFTAKEAVYKAWFPLARRWLGFDDAVVRFHRAGTFHAALLVDGPMLPWGPLRCLTGRWIVRRGLALTAVALPREPDLRCRDGCRTR